MTITPQEHKAKAEDFRKEAKEEMDEVRKDYLLRKASRRELLAKLRNTSKAGKA